MLGSRRKTITVPLKHSTTHGKEPLVPFHAGSPSKHYVTHFEIELGYRYKVVTNLDSTYAQSEFAMIRQLKKEVSEKLVCILRGFHPNIVHNLALYDCTDESGHYGLVSEHMPTSVLHMCRSPKYLTDGQLASVLSQVLCGAEFLAENEWVHEDLSCANILVNLEGHVKIGDIENCKNNGDKNKLIKSFTVVMMRLMDKKQTDDSELGISRQWSEEATGMFEYAKTLFEKGGTDISALIAHKFIGREDRAELRWFVQFTMLKARHDVVS